MFAKSLFIVRDLRRSTWSLVIALFVGVTTVLPAQPVSAEDLAPSVFRGGRLYDNWYKELNAGVPRASHPAYPAKGSFAADPARNWLCSECHGWDYRGRDGVYATGGHATGIKGIQGSAGTKVEDIVAILKDDNHGYNKSLNEDELTDLANFVSSGQIDMDKYIDRATGKAKGDPAGRSAFYLTVCASCHGYDGRKLLHSEHLGKVANEEPWETLHRMLYGHPGVDMPAMRVVGMDVLVDVLAYLQTLPAEEAIVASINRGGRLYDNWIREKETLPPRGSNPTFPAGRRDIVFVETTWRCKECHGWDYRGRDLIHKQGERRTHIKGIERMAGADAEEIVAILKDKNHRFMKSSGPRQATPGVGDRKFPDALIAVLDDQAYEYRRRGPAGELMDERDLRDIANFVSRGQIDMDKYIDRKTGKSKGNPAGREIFYQTVCAKCHGATGADLDNMLPLGNVARGDPAAALHKIANGHPAGKMPALRVLGMGVLADVLAYLQSLPGK